MITFGKALREAIDNSPLGVKELSNKLTISKPYIYKIMKGEEQPSEQLIRKLMKYLDFSTKYDIDIDLLSRGVVPIWMVKQINKDKLFTNNICKTLDVVRLSGSTNNLMRNIHYGLI